MGGDAALVAQLIEVCARELMLFAAVGLALGGLDELAVDLVWVGRTLWRAAIRVRFPRATADALVPAAPGRMAIFVPAWEEAAVIGRMLGEAFDRWADADIRIYLGCYPNDLDTIAAGMTIAAGEPRLRLAVNPQHGPTTKADCLNGCWAALQADEAAEGWQAKAIVLHDAEDVVDAHEIRVYDALIERFALVQLPVLPLIYPKHRWVHGSYLDEFAEAHGKTLPVREAVGAGVPSAGVGCAVARRVLADIAARRGGRPFEDDCLTEDYELGLRIAEAGERGVFVWMPAAPGAGPVAVRAYFPTGIEAAVRQKARWVTGIAFAGWDRLGWSGGLGERWMRLRDRRAPVAALVILASYVALGLQLLVWAVDATIGREGRSFPDSLLLLADVNAVLLAGRLAMRFLFVRQIYGWGEAWRSLPRVVVGNFIAVLAARRALFRYLAMRRSGTVVWDKTVHAFPVLAIAE